MKFLVDAMFGRLARWLRMSGYDTVYDIGLHDGRMIGLAKEEGRVLISRDKELINRTKAENVAALYVASLDFTEQLRQMEREFGVVFQGSPVFSRCPVCNAELTVACKKDIKAKVLESVIEQYDRFWVCSGCEKIYWHGGHWKNVCETLERLRGAKDD
jgi:uncharacterized protein